MASTAPVQNLRISDLMVPLEKYPCVSPDCSIAEAMQVMVDAQIELGDRRSLPRVLLVFEEDGRLLGTVRRRDIMRGLEPKFLTSQPIGYRKKLFDVEVDPNLAEMSYDRVVKGIMEKSHEPVRSVVRPIEVALQHDDHFIKGVYEMVSYGLTLLPVLREGRVVGVVRTVELFREMHRLVKGG